MKNRFFQKFTGFNFSLSQERFLHRGNRSELALPESNLNYRWNVPIQYVNEAGEYKLDWILTDKDLELRGYAGSDIWLDPEATMFGRFHFGSFQQFSEVKTVITLLLLKPHTFT